MVYQNLHFNCSEPNCKSYSAYVRIKKKWVKVGQYNSKCFKFTPNHLIEKERSDEIRRFIQEREEFYRPYLDKV